MKNRVICCIAIGLATVTARGYAQKLTQDAATRATDPLAMAKFIQTRPTPTPVRMPEPSLPMALAIDLSFIAGLVFVLRRRASVQRRRPANDDAFPQTE